MFRPDPGEDELQRMKSELYNIRKNSNSIANFKLSKILNQDEKCVDFGDILNLNCILESDDFITIVRYQCDFRFLFIIGFYSRKKSGRHVHSRIR